MRLHCQLQLKYQDLEALYPPAHPILPNSPYLEVVDGFSGPSQELVGQNSGSYPIKVRLRPQLAQTLAAIVPKKEEKGK